MRSTISKAGGNASLAIPTMNRPAKMGARSSRHYIDEGVIHHSNQGVCGRREAEAALRCAKLVLANLGVRLNLQKTRIVHVRQGFAFLGYKIKRGGRPMYLPAAKWVDRFRVTI